MSALALSPDKRTLAAGDQRGNIYLYRRRLSFLGTVLEDGGALERGLRALPWLSLAADATASGDERGIAARQ